MSIGIKIDDQSTRSAIRSTIDKLLRNAVPGLSLPETLAITMTRHSDHVQVEWIGQVEAVLRRMPDPDLIRARLYNTHAEVDLRISKLKVDYS